MGTKGASPTLEALSAAYLQRNLPPVVKSITVHPAGEGFQKPISVSGEPEILGLETDPLSERAASQRAPAGTPPAISFSRKLHQRGLRTFSWQAEDPNGDPLLYAVEYRAVGDERWRLQCADLAEPVFAWETASVPNGRYVVRVVASDAPGNPRPSRTAARRTARPSRSTTRRRRSRRRSTRGRIRVTVRDDASPVRSLETSTDAGRWEEVHPEDGIADSLEETFEIPLPPAGSGPASSSCGRPTSSATSPPPAWTFRRPPLHVLLVRAGALGDLLLLRRPISALRVAGHRVRLLAPSAPAAALLGPGGVEEVLPWDGPETTPSSRERPRRPAHGPSPPPMSCWPSPGASPFSTALGRRARRLVARDPPPPARGPHASLWLAGALEPLGIDARSDRRPWLHRRGTEPCAADAGAAGRVSRRAPRQRIPPQELADRALRRGRPTAVLGRALAPRPRPRRGRRAPPPGAFLAPGLPGTLGAALSRAGLFLGNDSGATHLAAASGTTTLALFGPTDPALWAPVGPSVATLRPRSGRLTDLAVDEVVAVALGLRALRPRGVDLAREEDLGSAAFVVRLDQLAGELVTPALWVASTSSG